MTMERGMVRMQPVKLAARRQRLACVYHVIYMTYPAMPCEAAQSRLLLVWIYVYLPRDFESEDLVLEINADIVTYVFKHTVCWSA